MPRGKRERDDHEELGRDLHAGCQTCQRVARDLVEDADGDLACPPGYGCAAPRLRRVR